jgi:hypothetical protein
MIHLMINDYKLLSLDSLSITFKEVNTSRNFNKHKLIEFIP